MIDEQYEIYERCAICAKPHGTTGNTLLMRCLPCILAAERGEDFIISLRAALPIPYEEWYQ